MNKTLSILFLILCITAPLSAQKLLQIETVNKVRTFRFFEGETLLFKFNEPDAKWERAEITGFDVDNQRIKLGLEEIPISEITAIRRPKRRFVQIVGGQLIVFGVSWSLATAIGDFLYNDDVNWTTAAIITGASIPAGFLILKQRTFKLKKRHRLRVLDITYPTSPEDLLIEN